MPPLGYTGPAPAPEPIITAPPIGYTGPAPSSSNAATPSSSNAAKPLSATSVTNKKNDEHPKETENHSKETLITATQMHSDEATGIVTATGKVEIVRGDYVLHADKVIYDQKTGVMTADGHVALLTPSGEVEFSDHQEVTGDMKQAFAANVGVLFPDNSRLAAKTAQHFDERYTVADNAVYTACDVCRDHPEQEPLWQTKSSSVTHDNVAHEIYYHNTVIDFAGVPIAYTPYMSGPDPSVDRREGLLSPAPGYNSRLGAFLRVPYYIDIAPDKDMTVTPTLSSVDTLQMETQYRQRFDRGNLQLQGSVTQADLISDTGYDEGKQWRGHLFGTFLYNIDNAWRAGSDVQYVSDKSYLNRYNISSLDQTTSRAYLEGFKGRDYVGFNSYYFQDLRPGIDASEPIILPSTTVSLLGDPGQSFGGRWSFDGNTLITQRTNDGQPQSLQGGDTRRLSLNPGWQRQFISDTGLVTTVSGLVRTDSYWANNVAAADGSGYVYDRAVFTRLFEQGNAIARYPMARSGSIGDNEYQHLVEPIVALTAAPNVRQISKQPIEDSLDVQFDETNLFSPNRFDGSDLVEGGSRVTYGLRNAITADSGARIDVFAGESYNFSDDNQFPALSGLSGHRSDYVGRVDFAPNNWINANYGFRLSEQDFSPQQQDAQLSFGAPIFRPSINYIEAYENDTATGLIDQVKQVTFGFTSNFAKYWGFNANHTQSFDPEPGPRSSGLGITYLDECFGAGINFSHDDTNRADINAGTSVTFHFFMKNLGGLHTDSTAGMSFPSEFRQTTP